ncbi:MAG: PaaI family thioesterase [Woeseiaceae bacterium]|nr:PaaI family thioesterase [Woeseiaceae bacterium]
MNEDVQGLFEGTYLDFLGFKLTTWKEGFVRLEMPVRQEHQNTVGYLHGGVISSLLDIAGAFAGSYGRSEDYVSVTINLNTTFISPSRSASVVAEGELVRRTKSLFFAQSRIMDPETNRLCATATGTYKPQARDNRVPGNVGLEKADES